MNVYDFDKTIYKKDCSVQFYLYVIKKKPGIFFKCIIHQLKGILLYKMGGITKEQMKEMYFIFLKYIDAKVMIPDFVEKEVKNINEWYYAKRQEDDVIISASPEFIVKKFAKKINVKNVIASNVDVESGKFDGENCYGEEKVKRFKAIYKDGNINEFYTDSFSDFPMAEMASKAFLVKNEKVQDFIHRRK